MAFVSPRMNLKVWNSPSDPFDHEQLADNFLKLDRHDHSEGRGAQIGAAGIQDGAITSTHLAIGGLTSGVLADGAVTNAKLGANAVTTDKISDGAVGTNDLANSAVTVAKVGQRPYMAVRMSALSIPNNTTTTINTWNEKYDNDSMCGAATGVTSFTMNTPGIWLLQARFEWALNGTGIRMITIERGTTDSTLGYNPMLAYLRIANPLPSNQTTMDLQTTLVVLPSGTAPLRVADTFRVLAYQNSGGALNINGSADSLTRTMEYSYLTMTWLGPVPA